MKYVAFAVATTFALCASRAESQSFKTLIQFTGTGGTASGANPFGSLIVSGTTLYGMTYGNPDSFPANNGNIFSVGTNGANYQNLISLTGSSGSASGANPYGNLMLVGTTFYGMTSAGGANNNGNIFSVSTVGSNYQQLVAFTGSGGSATGGAPRGSLVLASSELFGMTSLGADDGYGNVFSAGTGGTGYQNLVAFTAVGGTASGSGAVGSLILVGTTLYGMTQNGGASGFGNVFSVGTNGTSYQNLVSFTGGAGTASGADPDGSLIVNGTTLYGMTQTGGTNGVGTIFSVATDGSNYQNLLSFTGSGGVAIGSHPLGSLILSGTTLYGLTSAGGPGAFGNIFSVGINGSGYADLYNFTGGLDGSHPWGDLTLSSGTLFGMNHNAGANNVGTLFALALPTPEPGTLALVSCGAAALVSYRWRRGTRAAGRRGQKRR